ncbi:MAG: hypothetical protein ACP6IQ_05530 [Candidatus Njordarchaeia archaeon]
MRSGQKREKRKKRKKNNRSREEKSISSNKIKGNQATKREEQEDIKIGFAEKLIRKPIIIKQIFSKPEEIIENTRRDLVVRRVRNVYSLVSLLKYNKRNFTPITIKKISIESLLPGENIREILKKALESILTFDFKPPE